MKRLNPADYEERQLEDFSKYVFGMSYQTLKDVRKQPVSYTHLDVYKRQLLCGTKRAILIDTGLGVSNIREVIDGLTKLPVTVITTHVHWGRSTNLS